MNKAVKVILIIVVCIVVLLVVVGGAGVYYVSKHKQEWLEAGNKVMDEGERFGKQTDNDGCLAETIARAKREQGFSAAIGHNLFLRACLDASRPSPNFCAGVPGRTARLSTVRAEADTRRQPAEAAVPREDGSFVPWIAIWSPPLHPGGRWGWWPESPAWSTSGGPWSSSTRRVSCRATLDCSCGRRSRRSSCGRRKRAAR